MRIVIADDARLLRVLLHRLLREAGHLVVAEAADAAAALAAARLHRPDAVVLDGRLPPNGALAAMESLQGLAPSPAIYVIAALRETGLARAATAAGARGIVLRPLLAEQLSDVLSESM